MTKSDNQPTRAASPAAGIGAWVLLILIWSPLLWRLARMWRSETEQLFGFGVPVLVGWLLWQRRGEWAQVASAGRSAWTLAAAGALVLGVALLALEANPLWPTAAWLGTGGALLLTLAVIAHGHGWHGARLCAPVLVLMLTALKWPTAIYEPVMRSMMQINAVISAELVSLIGTPAVVQGNVIEVANGWVGVDEACSGLRSLQTVIMMAFFLGESGRLRVRNRLMLLLGAVVAALVVNVARTTSLTWMFANLGPEVEERWHDPLGGIALVVTLGLVWWWSERVGERDAREAPDAAPPVSGVPAWRALAVAAACVLVLEAGTQAWYRLHEDGNNPRISWALSGQGQPEWKPVEVPRRAADILNFESSDSYGRELSNPSRQMLAFAFRWEADLARAGIPELHDPLVCLPSVGAVREAELPVARVNVDGVEVPFRFIRFRQGTTVQHVWFCLWSTRVEGPEVSTFQRSDISGIRWARVRAGLRNDEREQLIFFVQGESDDAGAAEVLRDAVLTLMRRR